MERRAFMAGGGAAMLTGCARTAVPPLPGAAPPRLAPLNFGAGRLMQITVCLRPFRPSGPRLELECFGTKTVVHNYGHGGSGWSLSWGCAEEAARLARSGGSADLAVIGAGVIGLTTALRLIETGANVTIQAAQFPAETRSARATGVWSPSSRIGLSDAAVPDFVEHWERWARASWTSHLQAISRRDGVVVQYLGPSDDWGFGEQAEQPDPAETEGALATLRSLQALAKASAGSAITASAPASMRRRSIPASGV